MVYENEVDKYYSLLNIYIIFIIIIKLNFYEITAIN